MANTKNIKGTKGNDTLVGTDANDKISGRKGDDVIDPGAGSDRAFGGKGNDLLLYTPADNGPHARPDVYRGGAGTDTLQLTFTQAQWLGDTAIQHDVDAYRTFLSRLHYDHRGEANGTQFRFEAFDLRVSEFEKLSVVAGGVTLSSTAQILGTATGSVVEDTPGGATTAGNLVVLDLDAGQSTFGALASPLAGKYGTFTFSASTGAWTYTLDDSDPDTNALTQDQVVTDALTVTSWDGSASRDIVVTITGAGDPAASRPNDAPVAGDDDYTVAEDGSLQGNVAVNDHDADGDSLEVTVANGPAHGSLALDALGSFTYTPEPDFHGADSFSYTVRDTAGGTSTANVTITVTPVNDGPVAQDDGYTTNEDTPLVVDTSGVLANDGDADGDALQVTGVVTPPAHGALTLNADGTFSYTPAPNFNGTDTFTYGVSDGSGGTTQALVTLTIADVNDAPVVAGASYSTNEDTPLAVSGLGVLAGASDADGDALTASLVSGPEHGRLILSGDGSALYIPFENYHGSDSFSFKANDGRADSNAATIDITVNPVNDAPVVAGASHTTNEDTPLVLRGLGVLAGASDADGDTFWARLVSGPEHGRLLFSGDGSALYLPFENYHGADSFSFKANDGLADSNVATIDITVAAVNDAPVANDDTASVLRNSEVLVSPLSNDSDADGDLLSVLGIVGQPQHGSVLQLGDVFSYTPDAGYAGPDSFTYIASDGLLPANGTVLIDVL